MVALSASRAANVEAAFWASSCSCSRSSRRNPEPSSSCNHMGLQYAY